jgi:head-tail adaptor
MGLRAGDLQARTSVFQLTLVDLPNGGQEEQLVPIVVGEPSTPALPLAADEQVRLSTQVATATHRVQMRAPHDAAGAVIVVTAAMRVAVRNGWTGLVQDYAVLAVNNLEGRGRDLELVVQERVT